jgi:hypothetical protein
LQAVVDTHNDRRFRTIRYVIVDCLDVECFDVGMKTVMDAHLLNGKAMKTNPNVVVAIVTIDPLVSQFALLAHCTGLPSFETKVFDTVEDAQNWIKNHDRSLLPNVVSPHQPAGQWGLLNRLLLQRARREEDV